MTLIHAWDDTPQTAEHIEALWDDYEAREDDRICDDFETEVGQKAMDRLRVSGRHVPRVFVGDLYDRLCAMAATELSEKGDDDRCVTCGEPLPPYPGWWPDECPRCGNEGMDV